MRLPSWLRVFERAHPSAVMSVVHGRSPLVVDPGSLTDADELPRLLGDVVPATVVCSHYHSDHVGAVAALAPAARVAAHAWDAAIVNARDPQACAARWLEQPVLPYTVDVPLADGDTLDSGEVTLEVVHLPGHTLGQIGLWEAQTRTLICGDAFHEHDTPWLGPAHEGAGSLQRAALSLDRIEALDPALVVSGHGTPFSDVAGALERSRRRFARWAEDPAECGFYAARRGVIYRLMLAPIATAELPDALLNAPWVRDLARSMERSPDRLLAELMEMLDPVLETSGGYLRTTVPHRVSPVPLPWELADPRNWPPPVMRNRRSG